MGYLEDLVASGTTEKPPEISSFDREARDNRLEMSDMIVKHGQVYIPDRAKREAHALIMARGESQARHERQGLADLVALAKGIQGLDPQLQQDILQSRGLASRTPPAAVQRAMYDRQRALEVQRMRNEGRQGRGIPPDVFGAIGTPEFGPRLQSAAGQLNRQSLQTLYDLDRKERELRGKGNRPGRPSAQYQKLGEMVRMGIPITEATIRGVYGDKTPVEEPPDTRTWRERFRGVPKPAARTYSLGQLAGLEGETEEAPEAAREPAPEDRRRRLRGLLTGGGY